MSSQLKSFLFVAVLSIVCSSLLTLASTGLKEYQQRNIAIDQQTNLLRSVQLIDDSHSLTSETIEKLYDENIRHMWIDFEGKIISEKIKSENDLPIFLYVKQNEVISYIIPIDSRGLWGRILGYLSVENNGKTILGFTVYSHSETPGLGGEIEKSWFQNNFIGKEILDDAGHFTSVTIAKGTVKGRIPKNSQKHFVDGITGATFTGKFLSGGLKRTLFEYEPLSKRFRNKEIKRLKGVN